MEAKAELLEAKDSERTGNEKKRPGKALILVVTMLPQTVTAMISMVPPVMANEITTALGLSPKMVCLTSATETDLVPAGALLSTSQLASVAGHLGWGFVADRVRSPHGVLVAIAVLMAIATALIGLFSPAWPIACLAAFVIVRGGTASGWNGVYLAEIMSEVKSVEKPGSRPPAASCSPILASSSVRRSSGYSLRRSAITAPISRWPRPSWRQTFS
ncbi:hypothetical protein [uncultured Bradyrhizobium sp.]|uniref:hypothetical protein n=1 Tax=Bradyrhizobium sp. TaxID=376 RepID=UPI00262A18C2|nr:hypothetical protein [uncultured Bradyrhizobium sp.]